MKTITDKSSLNQLVNNFLTENKSIGFVPTMGALHQGHLSLVQQSLQNNHETIVSIFVNPTQFNNATDLEKYPRTLANDIALLETIGCHYVFAPSISEMYAPDEQFNYTLPPVAHLWEGAFRPGHFLGVAQIVHKLFELVQPTNAYFGLKDYQQFLVVNELVKHFKLPINIVGSPIYREFNGLAMSSRNERLSPHAREVSGIIHHTLLHIKEQLLQGAPISGTIQNAIKTIENTGIHKVEYLALANAHSLEPTTNPQGAILLTAVFCEQVRLIDNLLL